MRAVTALVGLTVAQIFDPMRRYAHSGGTGAGLYDMLIGETAIIHAIPAIVTWNIAHMRGLFPHMRVVTPKEF